MKEKIKKFQNSYKFERLIRMICFSLILCMLGTAAIRPAYSVSFREAYDWICEKWDLVETVFKGEKTASHITSEIEQSLTLSIRMTQESVVNTIFETFIQDPLFGKEGETDFFNFWDAHIGGGNSLLEDIIRFGAYTGMFIATLLFFYGIFIYFFSGKITDTKDTPISLGAKYLLALGVIKLSSDTSNSGIPATFTKLFYDLYASFFTHDVEYNTGNIIGSIGQNVSEDFQAEMGDKAGGWLILGMKFGAASVVPGFFVFILLLFTIILFVLIKNFIKLYCEMITRYVIAIILLHLFGAFAGTIVSNNSSNIFKSYMQTVISSFILFFFDILWFKLCLVIVFNKVFFPNEGGDGSVISVINFIVAIELLKLGPKFDGMLRGMGLGIATGASRVASSCGQSLRNLGRTFDMANRARRNIGEGMKAVAMNPNNKLSPDARKNMYDRGNKWAKGLGEAIVGIGTGGNSSNGKNVAMDMAAEYGKAGTIIPDNQINGKEAGDILSRSVNNSSPHGGRLSDALGALSNGKLKEATMNIAGEKFADAQGNIQEGMRVGGTTINANNSQGAITTGGAHFTIDNAQKTQYRGTDNLMHDGLKVEGQYHTNTGTIPFSGTIGSMQYLGGATAIQSGDQSSNLGLQIDNSMKAGDIQSFSNPYEVATFAGTNVANILNSVGGDIGKTIQNGGSFECVGKINGSDAFRVYDKNNTLMGSVTAGNERNNFSTNGFNVSNGMLSKEEARDYYGSIGDALVQQSNLKDAVLVNGDGRLNYSINPNDPSQIKYTIEGVNNNGEVVQKQAIAQNMGDNPNAELNYKKNSLNKAVAVDSSNGVEATDGTHGLKTYVWWDAKKDNIPETSTGLKGKPFK